MSEKSGTLSFDLAEAELGPVDILVNNATGWVTDSVRDHVEQSTELIHIVSPEEVAEVIVFLASDRGRLVIANIVHLR